ncbi:Ppx/GppA family phosphatase [Bacillus timonensis]|nr:Ppx/GppA family phosphatase [Bacillus timonensis]
MKDYFGIIDIGSNTIRLVIYKEDKNGRFKEYQNIKVGARLQSYLTPEKILSEKGVEILLSSLLSFQEVTRFYGVSDIAAVATATIRQSTNKSQILKLIAEKTDFQVSILSEYQEAFFGYCAVVNSTSINEGITVDIGGGSSEVTYFKDRQLVQFHSFPFGALSLTNLFVKSDIPTEKELNSMLNYIKGCISKIGWMKDKSLPLIAMGGSARALAQLDQYIKNYSLAGLHQYEFTYEDVKNTKEFISSLTVEDLTKLDVLSKERTDTIHASIIIFQAIFEETELTKIVLSRKGLRDGIFYCKSMNEEGTHLVPDVIEEGFLELAHDFQVDRSNVEYVTELAASLYFQFVTLGYLPYQEGDLMDLKRASSLFYVGGYVDSESSSQHTFYLLANRTIDGLLHKERVKLALLASYKNKATFKQYIQPFHHWFSKDEQKSIKVIGAVLKFAHSLNDTKRKIIKGIHLTKAQCDLIIHIRCGENWTPELFKAEKQKKLLEKAIKQPIILQFYLYK